MIKQQPFNFKTMKTTKVIAAVFLFVATFTACKKDKQPEPELAMPTIDNIEIGLNNNQIGVIGKDFHFNAEVLAGDKIENVQVKILPRSGESYAKAWELEITWDQYKDAKNATVHKHFDIPVDAVEGKYDFLIIVNDQNGRTLEEKREINVYKAENLPVDPTLSIFNVSVNGSFFYRDGKFAAQGAKLSKNDRFSAQATIEGVKGDGKMYLLLINKKLSHRPESIDQIDFDKVIVYDVYEHNNWEEVESFSNAVYDFATFTWVRQVPPLIIGATNDNNAPQPRVIGGNKAWESGTYYLGVVYKNTTYNMGYFQYIELPLEF